MNAVVLQEGVQTGVIDATGWAVGLAGIALALAWTYYLMR
jgi:hypothetical protein